MGLPFERAYAFIKTSPSSLRSTALEDERSRHTTGAHRLRRDLGLDEHGDVIGLEELLELGVVLLDAPGPAAPTKALFADPR